VYGGFVHIVHLTSCNSCRDKKPKQKAKQQARKPIKQVFKTILKEIKKAYKNNIIKLKVVFVFLCIVYIKK